MTLFLDQIIELIKKTRINRIKQAVLFCAVMSWQQTTAHAQFNDPSNRQICQGADCLQDSSLHTTGVIRSDKWFELINISTPTAPSANHARLFLNASTKQVCAIYSDGTSSCFSGGGAGGPITGVTAGLGLLGGGTSGSITLNLSTPIANSFIDTSSITKQGQNVIKLTSSLQSGATFFTSSGTANIFNSNNIYVANGTNTATAYSFSGSTNTGMYIVDTSTLGFSVASHRLLSLIYSSATSPTNMSGRVYVGEPDPATLQSATSERLTVSCNTDGTGSLNVEACDVMNVNAGQGDSRYIAYGSLGGSAHNTAIVGAAGSGHPGSWWTGGPLVANSSYFQTQSAKSSLFINDGASGTDTYFWNLNASPRWEWMNGSTPTNIMELTNSSATVNLQTFISGSVANQLQVISSHGGSTMLVKDTSGSGGNINFYDSATQRGQVGVSGSWQGNTTNQNIDLASNKNIEFFTQGSGTSLLTLYASSGVIPSIGVTSATFAAGSTGGVYNTASSSPSLSEMTGTSTVASVTFSTIVVHCVAGQTLCATEGAIGDPPRVMISTGGSYVHAGLHVIYNLNKPGIVLDSPGFGSGIQIRNNDNGVFWLGTQGIWNSNTDTQIAMGSYGPPINVFSPQSSNPVIVLTSDTVSKSMFRVIQPTAGDPSAVFDNSITTGTAGHGGAIQIRDNNFGMSWFGSDGNWQNNVSSDTAIAAYNSRLKFYVNGATTTAFEIAGTSITSRVTMGMGSNKITSLANGTASTDAAAYGQIFYGLQKSSQCTVAVASSTAVTSFVPTNLTCQITPTSSSSRIKITVETDANAQDNTVDGFATIERGTTNLGASNGFKVWNTGSGTGTQTVPLSMAYIDSPATTSATTYTVYIKSDNGAKAIGINGANRTAVMILEEIQ